MGKNISRICSGGGGVEKNGEKSTCENLPSFKVFLGEFSTVVGLIG